MKQTNKKTNSLTKKKATNAPSPVFFFFFVFFFGPYFVLSLSISP